MTEATQSASVENDAPQGPAKPVCGDAVTARAFVAIDFHNKVQPGDRGEVIEIDENLCTYRVRWASGHESVVTADLLAGVPVEL